MFPSVDEQGIDECRLIFHEKDGPREIIDVSLIDCVLVAMTNDAEETGEGAWA